MKEVEKMLSDKKLDIDKVQIPDELESRLTKALNDIPAKNSSGNRKRIKVASFLIAMILLAYNIDTLAYYGKTLTGYEQIMNTPLKNLNQLGKGQIIDKKHTFSNGTTIILDGIMLDENQLLAFYTIYSPDGRADEADLDPQISLKGLTGRHIYKGGSGIINDNKTEIKWIGEFETPYFFEKKLSLTFSLKNGSAFETGEITFILDRNKAMKHTLKKSINETIKIDDVNIRLDTIKASPTITRIEGKIQNILELAVDEISGERMRPTGIDLKLIANGKVIQQQGGGMSTDMKGITFEKNYEALPKDLKTLELNLVSFGADHDVNRIIELEKGSSSKEIDILGQKIAIERVYEKNEETYVAITTKDSVTLSRVYILLDGKRVELQETISENHEKMTDGAINYTRILRFKGTGKKLQMEVQRIRYTETFNKVVNIPVD